MSTPPVPGPARGSFAVSALFDDPAHVDDALARLTRAGVPRDLVHVVVSPTAARRFYPNRARSLGRETMRFAGIGGLIGLIVGAVVSLVFIARPGFAEPGLGAITQLLGPNLATVTGALVGAFLGLFIRRRAEPRFIRAAEAPDAIVVVVTARTREEQRALSGLLTASGGKEPRHEA